MYFSLVDLSVLHITLFKVAEEENELSCNNTNNDLFPLMYRASNELPTLL